MDLGPFPSGADMPAQAPQDEEMQVAAEGASTSSRRRGPKSIQQQAAELAAAAGRFVQGTWAAIEGRLTRNRAAAAGQLATGSSNAAADVAVTESPAAPGQPAHAGDDGDEVMAGTGAGAGSGSGGASASSLDLGAPLYTEGARSASTAEGDKTLLIDVRVGDTGFTFRTDEESHNVARDARNRVVAVRELGRAVRSLDGLIADIGEDDALRRTLVLGAALGVWRGRPTANAQDRARLTGSALRAVPSLADVTQRYVLELERAARQGKLGLSMRGKWERPRLDDAAVLAVARAAIYKRFSAPQLAHIRIRGWTGIEGIPVPGPETPLLAPTLEHVTAIVNTHPASVPVLLDWLIARRGRQLAAIAGEEADGPAQLIGATVNPQKTAIGATSSTFRRFRASTHRSKSTWPTPSPSCPSR
jgi:hypothetical protein